MEACYGETAVMERSCAVARGIDIDTAHQMPRYTIPVHDTSGRMIRMLYTAGHNI
jgi:hypothetical protein